MLQTKFGYRACKFCFQAKNSIFLNFRWHIDISRIREVIEKYLYVLQLRTFLSRINKLNFKLAIPKVLFKNAESIFLLSPDFFFR